MNTDRTLIVVPTYNERENVGPLVAELLRVAPAADVCLLDDASPDGTGEVADRLAAALPWLDVLHRERKDGLGPAYLAAFRRVLADGADLVMEMDADLSHDPSDLPRLLAALSGADLVIGSRYVPGGGVVNWPGRRLLLSRGGNLYVRLLLGLHVHDATAGYRVFRRHTLEKIDLEGVRSAGYVFQTDLAHRTVQGGLTVAEVPIDFIERERGDSKMSGAVASESLRLITTWGLQERRRQLVRAVGRRR